MRYSLQIFWLLSSLFWLMGCQQPAPAVEGLNLPPQPTLVLFYADP